MKNGAEWIAEERHRQMEKEGWDASHDAIHTGFELTKAAICYAASAAEICVKEVTEEHFDGDQTEGLWPFNCCFDKRGKHSQLKKLAIAGALIAAEIDRLQSCR